MRSDGHQLTLMKLALMNQCPQETRQWVDKAINKAPPKTLRLNMSRVQDMPRQDKVPPFTFSHCAEIVPELFKGKQQNLSQIRWKNVKQN